MTAMRKRWVIVLLVALLAAAGGFLITAHNGVMADADDTSGESFRTLLEVISLMKTQYFKEVDVLSMVGKYIERGTINGMLRDVLEDDPYTRFMDRRAWEQEQINIYGTYGGIGITVGMQDERLMIVSPFEGTPGFRAGLRSGDQIVGIDGRSTEFMSLDEAVSLMRGPEGTSITLNVRRRSGDEYDAEIVRAVIEVPSVSKTETFPAGSFAGQDYTLGYIRMQNFSGLTDREMGQALQQVQAEQAAGIILDLRDNLGGTLNAAIDVAGRFMNEGDPILHIVERGENKKTVYAARRPRPAPMPLIILVNGFSASASEILAGALQDFGYADVVGTQTFGKGLVQTVVTLRDGAALSLTSAWYQTALGRDIHEEGIVPDIVVEYPLDEDELPPIIGEELDDDVQFLKAVEVLMGKITAAVPKAS